MSKNQAALAENNQKIATVNNNLAVANKVVVDAQNNVNAKRKALADAQQALKELQDQVAQDQASGAAGFFKAIADNKDNSESLREDAQTAYNIITGQPNAYQDITVEWAKKAVKLGQENDSTSLSNIEKALGYYQHWMTYRDKYGLSHPSISLTAVAIAMLSSDFQHYSDEFNHPSLLTAKYGPFYEDEEDISAGEVNPIDNWMSEKDDIDKYIKEHPDAAAYSFESTHPLTQDEWEKDVDFWNDKPVYIGHYTSMIKPDANYVGLAGNEYEIQPMMNNADSMDEIIFNPINGIDFNSYQNLVQSYLKDVKQEDQLNTLKANVATANQNLIAAQNAVKSAQNNVQSLQANLAELNNGSTKINKAISDTQAALAKGQENLEFEQKQLDQANQTLADVQAKVGIKAKALEDAKAAQAEAAEAVAQAQNVLSEATATVKASQAKVDAAQNNVQAKDNNLKSAQAALDSLNQTLNNLENAQSNLSAAQTALNKANDDVTAANKAVKAQQLILDTLKESRSKADVQVTNASEELKKAEAELAAEQSKLEDAKARLDAFNKKETENSHKETSNPEKPVTPTNKPDTSHVVKPSDTTDANSTVKPTDKPDSNSEASTTNSSETTTTATESDVKDTDTVKENAKADLKTNNKSEEKSSTVKIVDNSDSSAVSVVLTDSNTLVKTFGEKTVNGTTYYKVSANRWVKADKAHVVAVTGNVTTNKLPQTGAKNELIAALSGLAVAGTSLVSYFGINRKKKNN
ncbi:LPXTG cell wall anchor domain-containing protein [Lactobacillus johnsonii]|uniref:LPXTG cell wall anchor domain-containing protein n=1 Tax=Lactobacillus johnsonii TaxID=33959 RepID=UPI0021B58D6A|nr:SLAP domain-containing protein [Lactobacillus johnsonii]